MGGQQSKYIDTKFPFSEFDVVDSELSDAVLIHPNINKELKKEFLTQLKKKVAKLAEKRKREKEKAILEEFPSLPSRDVDEMTCSDEEPLVVRGKKAVIHTSDTQDNITMKIISHTSACKSQTTPLVPIKEDDVAEANDGNYSDDWESDSSTDWDSSSQENLNEWGIEDVLNWKALYDKEHLLLTRKTNECLQLHKKNVDIRHKMMKALADFECSIENMHNYYSREQLKFKRNLENKTSTDMNNLCAENKDLKTEIVRKDKMCSLLIKRIQKNQEVIRAQANELSLFRNEARNYSTLQYKYKSH